MADIDVRVLSVDNSEDLTFAKISEFDSTEIVNLTDYLLVSGYRDEEEEEVTRRISVSKIIEEASQYITTSEYMKWFIPVIRNQTIHWELHSIDEVGTVEGDTSALYPIEPIDLVAAIGEATQSSSGLMSATDKIRIDQLAPVTTETNGIMLAEDKVKLNGIEAGANNYVLPNASTNTLGGVKVDGTTIVINQDGVIRSTGGTPTAYDITLGVSSWDVSTGMLHVNIVLDTTNRNVVDVDPSSLDEWVDCRVHAVSEDPSGITFACQTLPLHTLYATVISMPVARPSS